MNTVLIKRKTSVCALIATVRPPRPVCFADDLQWHSWLNAAHASGLRIVRRVDRVDPVTKDRHAPYQLLPTPQIPYCVGCESKHRERMRSAGLCQPCDASIEDEES